MYITNNLGIKIFNQPIQNRWMRHTDSPVSFGSNRLERSPKCDEVSFTSQKQKPIIVYDDVNWGDRIIFPTQTNLKEVSEFLLSPEFHGKITCFDPEDIKAIGKSKLANTKIKELLGYGTSACAFLMEDGNVLKIANCDHFGRKREDFDIPIYEEGFFKNEWGDPLYYYIEQYADPNCITQEDVDGLEKKMEAKGYGLCDMDSDFYFEKPKQIGKTPDGNVYLIDPECAYKI